MVQIPVFFALYKVLYVTIEMRHAPFYGWIKDLSAPDPTNRLQSVRADALRSDAGARHRHFLMIGIWPLIMGVTMWVQMKLNPPPPDPVQAQMFAYMPLIFTFMLGEFPGGPGDLLGVEQSAVGAAAVADHDAAGRGDSALGNIAQQA